MWLLGNMNALKPVSCFSWPSFGLNLNTSQICCGVTSVRPKQFTDGSFGESFGQFSAETLSSLLAIFGHSAERIFSVEMCIFGRKLELTACGFLVEYHKYNFLDQIC